MDKIKKELEKKGYIYKCDKYGNSIFKDFKPCDGITVTFSYFDGDNSRDRAKEFERFIKRKKAYIVKAGYNHGAEWYRIHVKTEYENMMRQEKQSYDISNYFNILRHYYGIDTANNFYNEYVRAFT